MIPKILLVLMIVPLVGCFSVKHAYQGDKILTPGAQVPGYTAVHVRHFEAHDRQFFWIRGGYPVGEPLNGAALAAKAAEGHSGVVNLRIRDGQDLQDLAVTHVACLLSFVCGTWSAWAEGDVVDLEAGK